MWLEDENADFRASYAKKVADLNSLIRILETKNNTATDNGRLLFIRL